MTFECVDRTQLIISKQGKKIIKLISLATQYLPRSYLMYLNGVFIFRYFTILLMSSSRVVRDFGYVYVSHLKINVTKKKIAQKKIENIKSIHSNVVHRKLHFYTSSSFKTTTKHQISNKKPKEQGMSWNFERKNICKNNIGLQKIHGIDCCS